jgi:3-hydroxyisobutyrate dehydrogenase-like beta-hydroxyacid dehydrogenase
MYFKGGYITMVSTNVGFIGLGHLGKVVAKKLAFEKAPMIVYDLNRALVDELVKEGAKAASSSREVAANSDVIIILVRDERQNDQVIFGKDGVWEGISAGKTIVLSATINPSYARNMYAKAKEKGVRVIDAPITAEARSFTLGEEWGHWTLFIGGDEEDVKRCWPVFEAMGKNLFYLGPVGSGMAGKAVNNLAMYANNMVARECANLAIKAGLDLKQIAKGIMVGTGRSGGFSGMGRRAPSGPQSIVPAHAPGEPPIEDLGTKDKRVALELADEVGAAAPIVRFMEKLDMEKTYDGYSAAMRRR